jgi:peptide/nickel transport system substrate-binding protein
MKLYPRLSILVTCLVLVSMLLACGGTPSAEPPTPTEVQQAEPTAVPEPIATQGGTLVFGMSYEPSTLDPHVGSSYEGATVDRAVFDTLVRQDTDGTFHPGLASSWQISGDGLTYTFHLKEGVKFHDGTPLNAEAVKFNFDRIIAPETASEQAIALVGPYKSAEVVDDVTVKLILSEPFGPFLSGIAQPNVGIVSPTAVAKYGDLFADNLVGTGPFMFKEYVRADHITLVRNPDYAWGSDFFDHQGPAYLDEIQFKFIEEALVRSGTLETGETSLINDVAPDDFVKFAADSKYTTYNIIQPGTPLAVAMNVTKAPLDDLKVRQAIEYAIDKKAIVDTLFAGLYELAYSPLAPNTLGYWKGSEEMYGYDPEEAKSLLAEAGWADSDGDGILDKEGTPFKIEWPTFKWQRMNEMATIMQAQLKEVGIDLAVDVVGFSAMYEAANKCEHNLVHTGNTDADPNALSIVYNSANVGNGWAWSCMKDDEIDQFLKEGRATTDPAARIPIYEKLQQRILDLALVIPIRQFTNLLASPARVNGLRFEPIGFAPEFYDVHFEK